VPRNTFLADREAAKKAILDVVKRKNAEVAIEIPSI